MTIEFYKKKVVKGAEFVYYILVDRTKDQVEYDLYLEKQNYVR